MFNQERPNRFREALNCEHTFSIEKFNKLTYKEKGILASSIEFFEYCIEDEDLYRDDDVLYTQLNHFWCDDSDTDPKEYIAIVSKLN